MTIGLLNDFQGGPTVLALASDLTIERFADDLRNLADRLGGQIDVSQLDYVAVRGTLTLVIQCAASYSEARGLVNPPGGRQSEFLWLLEDEMLREAADKVAAMAGSPAVPCHQYLDVERLEDARVMVSKGEYDPSIFDHAI